MNRPHPLTAMKEWEWSQTWEEQQEIVDRLKAKRGTWLPNVVEQRRWGVVRWTSGRPSHAATSGQAVAETFVVFDPKTDDPSQLEHAAEVLRDPAPMFRVGGVGLRRHQLMGAAPGAAILGLLLAIVFGALGGSVLAMLGLIIGAGGGALAGGAVAQITADRHRTTVLDGGMRVVTGRYAPTSWTRLVEAATALERTVGPSSSGPDVQAVEAVQSALWEAAGLLLSSSDHTGVEVLADAMERLARAHRG